MALPRIPVHRWHLLRHPMDPHIRPIHPLTSPYDDAYTKVIRQPITTTCLTCYRTYALGAVHNCPTKTCLTCHETYTVGTMHSCPTTTCFKCYKTYTLGTIHICQRLW